MTVIIDGATLYSAEPFEYMKDSTVKKIQPSQTILNGGTEVLVTGTNLHIVQHPKIGVVIEQLNKNVEDVSH